MILEGLLTTTDAAGAMHVAAMGPVVDDAEVAAGRIGRLVLRPFASSQTAAHLAARPEGVFHATDDVLLVARVVTGAMERPPAARPAAAVRGWVLEEACRAWEFTVAAAERGDERQRLEARVVAEHAARPFLGFNRAAHAVIEGCILVTRLHLLGVDEVARRLGDLAPLVDKTGGPREREAFDLVRDRARFSPPSPSGRGPG
ncbi:MAG: DUF447 domain-containing protein [Planctomycetaceae bacterium]